MREFVEQVLRGLRVDDEADVELIALHFLHQHLLQSRIERECFHHAGLALVVRDKIDAEPAADLFGKVVGIFRDRREVGDALHDDREIFDRDAFAQKVLQHALDDADIHEIGNEFAHERGVRFLHVIHERLHVLPSEDEVRRAFDGFGKMRDQHRARIDDGVAVNLRRALFLLADPRRIDAKNRLDRGDAFQRHRAVRHVHREPAIRDDFAAREFLATQEEAIFLRLEFQIVADRDGRNDDADFAGKSFSHTGHAIEQIATVLFLREMEKSGAEFDREGIDFDELLKFILRLCHWLRAPFSTCDGGLRRIGLGRERRGGARFPQRPRGKSGRSGEQPERNERHPRHDPKHRQKAGRNRERARVKSELFGDVRAQIRVAAGARDEDTRRDADHERGHLRDESVTDRKQRIFLQRLHDRQPFLHDADRESAEDVDERDEDARDRIAAHKLARSIHRTVKIRFFLHLHAPLRGRRLVDDSRVEFRVDGHLFSRHRIEGETRRDFRDAARALGDDHEIDHDQNQEDDRADDVVPTNHEMPERVDDGARVPIAEDESRGRDVQRESVKRDGEKQRGKARELRRVFHVNDDEQDQQRDADAGGEQQIEQHRGDGHD